MEEASTTQKDELDRALAVAWLGWMAERWSAVSVDLQAMTITFDIQMYRDLEIRTIELHVDPVGLSTLLPQLEEDGRDLGAPSDPSWFGLGMAAENEAASAAHDGQPATGFRVREIYFGLDDLQNQTD